MKRIKLVERLRLLRIANRAINKLNSEKNQKKPHWLDQGLLELDLHFMLENQELRAEVLKHAKRGSNEERIIDECYDNINLPLMIVDKVMRDGRK